MLESMKTLSRAITATLEQEEDCLPEEKENLPSGGGDQRGAVDISAHRHGKGELREDLPLMPTIQKTKG